MSHIIIEKRGKAGVIGLPAHVKYILPSSAHADLIIDQNDFINSVDQVLDTIIDCLLTIDSKKSVC